MKPRKRKPHRRPPPPPSPTSSEPVSVMQVSKNWGPDHSRYFEDGDSGTSSDEEHYVESAVSEERKHLSTISEDSFKAFSNIRRLQAPLDRPDDITDIERSLEESQLAELQKSVTQTIRDVSEASRALQQELDESEIGLARRQLFLSILTNGCFYLHLIGSGFKSGFHPALRHIQQIKKLLEIKTAEEEDEGDKEEEESVVTEKHVPNQLKTVPEGAWRPVSRTIATGRIVPPNRPGMRKNPRRRERVRYQRMKERHERRIRHRNDRGSGFYHGQFAGIDPNKRGSVKLHPAH